MSDTKSWLDILGLQPVLVDLGNKNVYGDLTSLHITSLEIKTLAYTLPHF